MSAVLTWTLGADHWPSNRPKWWQVPMVSDLDGRLLVDEFELGDLDEDGGGQ